MRTLRVAVVSVAASLLVGIFGVSPAAAAPPIRFAPVANYPTGSGFGPGPGAQTTVTADVDSDGDLDAVITDWLGGGPLVLRNQGMGTFGPAERVPSGGGVLSIASGDFNEDGRPDLAGRTGYSVFVWPNNGNGSFGAPAQLSSLGNAQPAIAVADLNGDGNVDIVVPSALGVQVFNGNGNGTFSTGPLTTLLALMSDVAVANLDGDGVPDLLVVDATPLLQRVVALRGLGDGSFVQTGSGPVGYGPEGVIAADLDNDGIDDAVSVDSFSIANSLTTFSITVLPSTGAGQFGTPAHYPTGAGPVSGTAADFNADGNIDIAVSAVGAATVTVYAGEGTGALATGQAIAVTPFPQTPSAGDLDLDGRVDLAIPGAGQLSVLLNIS